jgi:putative ABC transport system permease protein
MAAKLILVAIRNMLRQPRRTILTGLTFAIAVFIYTVLIAVPASMNRITEDISQALRLVVTAPNAYRLPAKYCGAIQRMPHVLGCAPAIQFSGIYRDPKEMIVTFGVSGDINTITASSDYQVPPDKIKELTADRRWAAIGSVLMHDHGWKIGHPFTLRNPSDQKMTMTFIPVVELPVDYESKTFLFDRRQLDDAVKNAYGVDLQDRASFLLVKVDRSENMGLVANMIDENFHNSESQTETVTESDSIANFATSIGDLRAIIYGLSIVVLLTVLLIAANSMAMMVRDRMGEVAIMRAIGFTHSHVTALLLSEAALIGSIGAMIGAIAALWYFRGGVTLAAINSGLSYMEVRLPTAIAAVVVAILVSLASAAAPVINAARVAPAIAIRKVI